MENLCNTTLALLDLGVSGPRGTGIFTLQHLILKVGALSCHLPLTPASTPVLGTGTTLGQLSFRVPHKESPASALLGHGHSFSEERKAWSQLKAMEQWGLQTAAHFCPVRALPVIVPSLVPSTAQTKPQEKRAAGGSHF